MTELPSLIVYTMVNILPLLVLVLLPFPTAYACICGG